MLEQLRLTFRDRGQVIAQTFTVASGSTNPAAALTLEALAQNRASRGASSSTPPPAPTLLAAAAALTAAAQAARRRAVARWKQATRHIVLLLRLRRRWSRIGKHLQLERIQSLVDGLDRNNGRLRRSRPARR